MIMRSVFVGLLMVLAAIAAAAVKPAQRGVAPAPNLNALMPAAFGDWAPLEIASVVLPQEADLGPGEAVLYRAWKDQAGRIVTLVVAYGPPLGDSVRLHRPEACYRAQGFAIRNRRADAVTTAAGRSPIIRLDTENAIRSEAVTYWLREGDSYIETAYGHQLQFLMRGLAAADGALVRVSSSGEGDSAWALHDRFLKDFVAALSPEARALLMAAPS